jgi:hypothetical protein
MCVWWDWFSGIVLRNLEGYALPFYKLSSMSDEKREMTAMGALGADQRHSRQRESEKRGANNPQLSRSTSSSFEVLPRQKRSIPFAAHRLEGK